MLLEDALSVTWKWSHLLVLCKKSQYHTVLFSSFFFLFKLWNYQHLTVVLLGCQQFLNSLGFPFIPNICSPLRYFWNPMQSCKGDSVGCLQPSHITLIDAAWLHRGLSTHSVCSAVESSWPSIDSSYTPCHLVDQFLLHSRKPNATPPLGSRHTQRVKIPYGWWGEGGSNHCPNAWNKSACKALFQSKP